MSAFTTLYGNFGKRGRIMKYIDADKLTKAIEDKGLDCSFVLKMERLDTLALIDELRESEDERIRARLIEYFKGFLEGYEDCYKDGGCVKWEGLDVKSILAWLKSLRPVSKESLQPHWKPSENQMSMLLAVVNDPNNAGSESCHLSLESLYYDLKKL